jgi:choline dehydrogenase-like flavoprotein
MFQIELLTQTYRPDLLVTIRTGRDWQLDLPGSYQDDRWVFTLDEQDHPGGVVFKFVLDRTAWMEGANLQVPADPGSLHVFDDTQVRFPPNQELVTDNGHLQRLLFPPRFEDREWDVLIIGSGMGGGILADQLSDAGVDVLVLEAGSYLFPTHVGNLPRKHNTGRFDKHLWNLYELFKVNNYAPGGLFQGGQGFNLGGRSVFWGGLIPQMSWWELEPWPQELRFYLRGPGYQRAEALMNRVPLAPSAYRDQVMQVLRATLPDFQHLDAPMAVNYPNPTSALVPTGLFSTADLLTESRLTPGTAGQTHLWINLNHAAVALQHQDGHITGVVAHDLIANRRRTFRAKRYVLAAGTIESAKLALLSGLEDPNSKIGVGLTDHPILFLHFTVPAGSPLYNAADSAKTLSQHLGASLQTHPYNLLLELGADLNQGRYVDDDIFEQHRRERGDNMLCEVVFLLNTPLLQGNRLRQDGPSFVKPTLTMGRAAVADELRAELVDHARRLLLALGGIPIGRDDIGLTEADLGGVAHEVGTLQLADDGNGVVDTDLRFLAYDNLYACDLSVFPTSPAANPSLTLAALALRLADHLATTT